MLFRANSVILFIWLTGCQADVVPLMSNLDASRARDQAVVDAGRQTTDAIFVGDGFESDGPVVRDAERTPATDANVVNMDSTADILDAGLVDSSVRPDMSVTLDAQVEPVDALVDQLATDMIAPQPCVQPVPNLDLQPAAIEPDTCMTCIDAPIPSWRLSDFQDDSCGTGLTYGLDSFAGRTTLVALFNAGCGYCQSQAQNLDRMAIELADLGHSVYFAAVNGERYAAYQDRIIHRCRLPFFQDTLDVDGINSMGGSIYDMYVYRPDGTLHVYLSGSGEIDTYLSEPEGYENVREAILSSVRGEAYVPPNPPVMIAIPDGGAPDDEAD